VKARVIIPWFGSFPPWINAFLNSCAPVTSVDWLIIHDKPPPDVYPCNVEFKRFGWEEYRRLFRDKCSVELPPRPDYKICDAKVFLGTVFEEALQDYDYFGWGDLDLVYGELDAFLRPLLGQYSVISFHRDFLSNHFVLFRNTPVLRGLFRKVPDFSGKMALPEYAELDDVHLTQVAKEIPDTWFAECYTTPFVNWTPWADGTYNFPARWEWHCGRLINDLDRGYTFPYFHFMVWKGGDRFYYHKAGNWEKLPDEALTVDYGSDAFVIDLEGMHEIPPKRVAQGRLMGQSKRPNYSVFRRIYLKIRQWRAR
jgi:hypothetical protein